MKKVLLLLLVLRSISILCQQLPDDLKAKIVEQTTNTTKRSLFTPGAKSDFFGWISQISVTAQKKDQKANLNVDHKNKSNTTVLHFGASQTLSEGSAEATPFNLTGISNGTSISIGFTQLSYKPKMTIDQLRNFENVRKQYFDRLHQEDQQKVTRNQLYPLLNESERNELARSNIIAHPLQFSLLYQLEKNNFDFVTDSTALIANSESKYAHKFIAGITYFLKTQERTQQLLNLSTVFSSNYTAGDKVSLLIPFGTTRNYYTQEVTFGMPEHKADEILGVEYRLTVNNKNAENTFALGAAFNYAIQKRMLAFQLPVYFIRSADNTVRGLQGGIRLGYLTSTEKGKTSNFKEGFSAEFVITEPFDVFK